MYPLRYYASRYYPGRYYPHVSITPTFGSGYYPPRYYARRYYPTRYYPGAVNEGPVGQGAGYYAGNFYARRFYPLRYYPGSSGGIVYPDLLAAIIAWLRTNDGGSVATAFGDTPSTPKFFPRREFGKLPPYATFEEPQSDDEYSSDGNYIVTGIILATIYSSSGQVESKRLADLVRRSLNDAPLVYANERLMKFRSVSRNVVIPDTSVPLAPSLFQRPVVFSFMASGQI
jgi:hypothetical protein